MANKNRKTLAYDFPRPISITKEGTVVNGTFKYVFEFDAGNLDVDTLDIQYIPATRTANGDEIDIPLYGPASTEAVAEGGSQEAIDAWLAAGGAALNTDGWIIKAFASSNGSGMRWEVTVPGNTDDSFAITTGTATTYAPEGDVTIKFQLTATDGTDTYFWGDFTDTNDIVRSSVYTVGRELDVEELGVAEPVLVLDDANANAISVLRLKKLDPSDIVRVKTLIEDSALVSTAGYQVATYTTALLGASPTGLANDATAYTMTVAVDGGGAQPISVVGSAAQTWTTLLAEINADLTGATAAIDANSNLRITSDVAGAGSSIAIVDTNLLSTTTNFSTLQAAVAGDTATDLEKLQDATKAYNRFIVTDVPNALPGGPALAVVGTPVQGTSKGKKGEIWVAANGSKVFINIDGTPSGWYSANLTVVV